MTGKSREIVIPSQFLGEIKNKKAGRGTYVENGKIYSGILGVLNESSKYIDVVSLKGKYEPVEKDFVIAVVSETLSSAWLVDINAPYPALLHVKEVPWDVEFNETDKYLNTGDVVMAKILQVDQEKKLQITLKDRNLYKVKGGEIIEVQPSKVPRIIGKKGSMIRILKKYTKCRMFVGQNGRIWIDGTEEGLEKLKKTIRLIEREALSYGLTNRVEEMLKKDAKEVH